MQIANAQQEQLKYNPINVGRKINSEHTRIHFRQCWNELFTLSLHMVYAYWSFVHLSM